MTPKLRWKREPLPKGLAAIGAPPPGSKLWDGSDQYAFTYSMSRRRANQRSADGWFWVARHERVALKNTCANPCATEDEAKRQALAYVQQQLAKAVGSSNAEAGQ